ncbi:MAG: AAA family ATPase, partial [Acidimicrobiia bacterium]
MPEWPLVGRGEEFQQLVGWVASRRRGVVLAGPPGVGKTRLAVELLNHTASQGFVPLRVAATEITSRVPLGAFAVLIPELSRGIDRLEMLQEVARGIAEAGQGQPVALLVDDAHLLDETSAALTAQLVATEKAFLIATVRSGTAVPAPVLSLWKDGLAERVELDALDETQVEELLKIVLQGPLDAATRSLLYQRSEGNVLYLHELVLAALESGVLHKDEGLWKIRGRLPASARLVELVETRLSVLHDADRQALELLTVGEPLGIELFERQVGADVLANLERHQLVTVDQAGR